MQWAGMSFVKFDLQFLYNVLIIKIYFIAQFPQTAAEKADECHV